MHLKLGHSVSLAFKTLHKFEVTNPNETNLESRLSLRIMESRSTVLIVYPNGVDVLRAAKVL